MLNISGFGISAQVTASKSFPSGFTVTAFAENGDPLDSPDLAIANAAVGVNGDMVVWTRPELIDISMSVIPTSDADQNLAALLEANRVAKNKQSARDVVGIVWTYPNGMVLTCSPGIIVSGSLVPVVTSEGRIATRKYAFKFQTVSKAGGQ